MEVSSELHASAALPTSHWIASWMGPGIGLGVLEKIKSFFSYGDSNPAPSSPCCFHYTDWTTPASWRLLYCKISKEYLAKFTQYEFMFVNEMFFLWQEQLKRVRLCPKSLKNVCLINMRRKILTTGNKAIYFGENYT